MILLLLQIFCNSCKNALLHSLTVPAENGSMIIAYMFDSPESLEYSSIFCFTESMLLNSKLSVPGIVGYLK